MKHLFIHSFEDDPPLGDFEVEHEAPAGGRIEFHLDGEDIWLSANRAGWLHLARICAEMGMHRDFVRGYHFHMTYDWQDGGSPGREVTFELIGDDDAG